MTGLYWLGPLAACAAVTLGVFAAALFTAAIVLDRSPRQLWRWLVEAVAGRPF